MGIPRPGDFLSLDSFSIADRPQVPAALPIRRSG
jgi:hypothetical protein